MGFFHTTVKYHITATVYIVLFLHRHKESSLTFFVMTCAMWSWKWHCFSFLTTSTQAARNRTLHRIWSLTLLVVRRNKTKQQNNIDLSSMYVVMSSALHCLFISPTSRNLFLHHDHKEPNNLLKKCLPTYHPFSYTPNLAHLCPCAVHMMITVY